MKSIQSRVPFFLILAAIGVAAIIRWRLLGLPFERDEGEYAYMGTLVLKGLSPYTYAYSMKLPGIYVMYALIMKVFGQTRYAVHGGLILVNGATSFLVFLLARRLFGARTALASGAIFAMVSLNTRLHGITANSEHFVILFAVAGLYLLVRATEREGGLFLYFLSGILLGSGMMMKQHGLFFLLMGPVYVLILYFLNKRGRMGLALLRAGLVLLGGAAPLGAACIVIYAQGGFKEFWFWTFTYSRLYVSPPPLMIGVKTFWRKFSPILLTTTPFWVLTAVGAVSLLKAETRPGEKAFVILFAIFSALSITPGLYFREHYFVLLLPAASLLAGLGVDGLSGLFRDVQKARAAAIVLTLAAILPGLFMERHVLFRDTPEAVSRQMFGMNPFPESVKIAKYIRKNSDEGDTVAILGSEPQILFYSGRASATPYIYAYPLMEYQGQALEMQKEMIADIESRKPRYILFVDIYNSWLRGRRSVGFIFNWFGYYWPERYEVAGFVDIRPEGTRYIFGERAKSAETDSPYSIIIYKRKDSARGLRGALS